MDLPMKCWVHKLTEWQKNSPLDFLWWKEKPWESNDNWERQGIKPSSRPEWRLAGTPKHPRKAWSSKAGQMPLQCLDTSGRFGRLGPDVRVVSSHASKWGCSSGDHTLSNLCIMGIPRIVKVKATSILATPATLCYQSMVVVYLILSANRTRQC